MNPSKRHLLKPPNTPESHRCTSRQYIVIDITPEIRKFIERVDSRVEDLSYDLDRVIRMHHSYKPGYNSPNEQEELLMELLHSGIVKNEDDASVISEAAMYQLYPDITTMIQGLGYRQSIIHQVKLNTVSRTRSISCSLLMAVL